MSNPLCYYTKNEKSKLTDKVSWLSNETKTKTTYEYKFYYDPLYNLPYYEGGWDDSGNMEGDGYIHLPNYDFYGYFKDDELLYGHCVDRESGSEKNHFVYNEKYGSIGIVKKIKAVKDIGNEDKRYTKQDVV
jgi:hypothetical protein